MKRYRVRVGDREQRARTLVEVMKHGGITCLRDEQFIVHEAALGLLDGLGITYTVLHEEAAEDVHGSVRNPVATQV